MANRKWGSERRGNDDDEGNAGLKTRKVQIENAYFEKLNARVKDGGDPVTAEQPQFEAKPIKPEGPGFVVFGDDGHPIKE